MRGANKAHRTPAGQVAAGVQLVAHDFGNGQLGNRFGQGFLQAFSQGHACHDVVQKQAFGLTVGLTLEPSQHRCEVGHIHAHAAQAFEQRGAGSAVCRQPHRHRHQFHSLGFVRRTCCHIRQMRCQTPRRGIRRQYRLRRSQALDHELIFQHRSKRIAQFFQRLGRQLFHKEFYKKVFRRCHTVRALLNS